MLRSDNPYIDRLNLVVDGFVPYLLERGRIRKQKAFKRNRVASKKQRGRAAVLDRAASGMGAAGSADNVVSHRNPHASLEQEEEGRHEQDEEEEEDRHEQDEEEEDRHEQDEEQEEEEEVEENPKMLNKRDGPYSAMEGVGIRRKPGQPPNLHPLALTPWRQPRPKRKMTPTPPSEPPQRRPKRGVR